MDLKVWLIEKERLAFVTLHKTHRPVGQKIRQLGSPQILRRGSGPEIEVRTHVYNRFVESAFSRRVIAPLSNVPLAKHPRRITRRIQGLPQNHEVGRETRHIVRWPQWPTLQLKTVDASDRVDAVRASYCPFISAARDGVQFWQ